MKAITNLTRYNVDTMPCKECRDGACTVSITANNQNNYINQMKIKVQTMTALIGQFPASAHFQLI
jgi:hypothetical protein